MMTNEILQTEISDTSHEVERDYTPQEGADEHQLVEDIFAADILSVPEINQLTADLYAEAQPGGKLQQLLDKLRSDRQEASEIFAKRRKSIRTEIQRLLDEQKAANDEVADTNQQLAALSEERDAIRDEIDQLEISGVLNDEEKGRYRALVTRRDQCGPREEIYRSNRKAANIKLIEINQNLSVQRSEESVIDTYIEESQRKEHEILARLERIKTGMSHIALGVEMLAGLGDFPAIPKIVEQIHIKSDLIVNDMNVSDFIPPVSSASNLTKTYFKPPLPPEKPPASAPLESVVAPEIPPEPSLPIRRLSPVKLPLKK